MTTQKHSGGHASLLALEGVSKVFQVGGGLASLGQRVHHVHAVNDVSFQMGLGETYGLVGESGSGKTTVGRMVVQLDKPTRGRILFNGEPSTALSGRGGRRLSRTVQMVFQDPYASLNPRQRIRSVLHEALQIAGVKSRDARDERTSQLLCQVGLSPRNSLKFPHEFSGGQRQRICLARALALEPKLIVCDEPVSALDVSIQAQILNLLREVQSRTGVGYLFISHDMNVVKHISHRIGVMYFGHIVEEGPASRLFTRPSHPYTEALLSAVPRMHRDKSRRERIVLRGEVPAHATVASGCVFASRCPKVMPICRSVVPTRVRTGATSWAACHLVDGRDRDED